MMESEIKEDMFVSGILCVDVWLSRFIFQKTLLKSVLAIQSFNHLLDLCEENRNKPELLGVFECFHTNVNKVCTTEKIRTKHQNLNASMLWEAIKPIAWKEIIEDKPGKMLYKLMRFQRKAVSWMIHRETQQNIYENPLIRTFTVTSGIFILLIFLFVSVKQKK